MDLLNGANVADFTPLVGKLAPVDLNAPGLAKRFALANHRAAPVDHRAEHVIDQRFYLVRCHRAPPRYGDHDSVGLGPRGCREPASLVTVLCHGQNTCHRQTGWGSARADRADSGAAGGAWAE